MITLNGYKKLSVLKVDRGAAVTVKTVTGTEVNSSYSSDWNNFRNYLEYPRSGQTSLAVNGVHFGTGNKAPTLQDYCFSGELIPACTISYNITGEWDENGYAITALYTITNTGSEPVTIGEVGIVEYAHKNANQINGYVLTERTALETPITIEPGGVGQVTYTIRMNYPTV